MISQVMSLGFFDSVIFLCLLDFIIFSGFGFGYALCVWSYFFSTVMLLYSIFEKESETFAGIILRIKVLYIDLEIS